MNTALLLAVVVGVVSAQVEVPLGALQAVRNAGLQTINDRITSDNQRLVDALEAFKPINASCNALVNGAISKCTSCVENKCKARAQSVCKPEKWQEILGKTIGFFKDGIPGFFSRTVPDVFVNKIGGGIVDVTKDVGSFFKDKIGGGIVDFGKKVGDGIVNVGKGAIDGIVDVGKKIGNGVVDFGKKIGNGVVDVGKKIGDGVSKAVDGIKNLGKSIGKALGGIFGRRELVSLNRRAAEPSCGDFERDAEQACKFYLKPQYCSDCSFDANANGVLAHAFYPKDGRVHFDDDEHWTVDGHVGKHLELIATHEFGHALGLHHSSIRDAVMSQSYPGYTPSFRLHEDDIKAITALYGARQMTVEPTKGPTSVGQSINTCKMKFDDVVRLPDGDYYVFRRNCIYKLNSRAGVEEGWPRLSADVYEDFPSTPDAVTYSRRDYRLFVFKGDKVWRYYKSRLEKGFPAEILKKSPVPIRAAFEWMDGIIYGLTARQVYIFDDHSLSWTHISSLRGIFPDAVYGVEAAVYDGHNSLYLFKGYWYYAIDSLTKRTKGFPKHKHSSWLGCKQSLRLEDAHEIS